MANVSFKRGLAANLPATAQDGVFYLTTDTNRLYVGQGEKLAELNRYIREVNTTDDLPAAGDRAVGDFVHVKTGNMLLVCNNTTGTDLSAWTQVNAQDGDHDTYVTSISKVKNGAAEVDYVTSDATGITVQFNINQTMHNLGKGGTSNIAAIPVSFKILAKDLTTANNVVVSAKAANVTGGGATIATAGAGSDANATPITLKPGSNVSISADEANNITIGATNTTYTMSAANNALTLKPNAGATQTVSLASDNDALTITGTNNKITVAHKAYDTTKNAPTTKTALTHGGDFQAITGVTMDKGHITGYDVSTFTLPADKDTKAQSVAVSAIANGGLSVVVTNSDNSATTGGTLANALYYTLEGSDTKYYNQKALPVYSKTDIDTKFKSLNAMVYKGTIAATGATVSALPTEGVQAGDTYLVAAETGTYGGHSCRKGDLLIASGKENANGVIPAKDLTWTYVPSGDDIDTQYSLKTESNTVKLVPSTNTSGNSGSINIQGEAGNIEVATGGTASAATLTVSHAKKSATPTTSTAAPKAGETFTAIGGITLDTTGHVSGIETKTVTLPGDTNTTYSVGVSNVATNAGSIALTPGGSGGAGSSVALSADGNITLTANASKKTVALAHKTVAAPTAVPKADSSGNATTTNLTHGGTFTVATNVVADGYGHITSYGTQTFKLPSDNNTTYTFSTGVSAANNVATITDTLKPNSGASSTASFTVKSNNLTVSASGAAITMDFEWGSF